MYYEEPLTDRMRKIINLLREHSYGFNELYHKLQKYTSRQTLKTDLTTLLEMRLIVVEKGRRGQKHIYTLKEAFIKFEERTNFLKLEWAKVFNQLKKLRQTVETDKPEHKKIGALVASLLYRAVIVSGSAVIADEAIELEAKLRLSNYNERRFHDFLKQMISLGEEHPKILWGFQKTCDEFLSVARLTYEEIESKIKLLYET